LEPGIEWHERIERKKEAFGGSAEEGKKGVGLLAKTE